MYKKITYICIILIGFLFCLPGMMGYVAHKKLDQLVQLYADNPQVRVSIQQYKQGWFSTQALLSYTFLNTDSPVGGKGFELVSQIKILHGPIILDIKNLTHIHFKIGQSFVRGNITMPPIAMDDSQSIRSSALSLESLIRLSGSSRSILRAKDFFYENKKRHFQLKIKNSRIRLITTRDMNTFETDQELEDIFIQQEDIKVNLSHLLLRSDYYRGDYGLWFGTVSANIPVLNLSMNEKNNLLVNEINFKSSTSLQGNVVNMVFDLMMDKFNYNQISYGPGDFHVAIGNLDAQTMGELNNIIRHWINLKKHSMDQWMDFQMQVTDLLPDLISRGFQLRFNPFAVKIPSGEISLQAWITMPNIHRQKNSLKSIFKKSDSSIVLTLPQSFFEEVLKLRASKHKQEEIQNKIQNMLEEGEMIKDGETYRFSFAYKNRKFYLSGKEIDNANKKEKVREKLWQTIASYFQP